VAFNEDTGEAAFLILDPHLYRRCVGGVCVGFVGCVALAVGKRGTVVFAPTDTLAVYPFVWVYPSCNILVFHPNLPASLSLHWVSSGEDLKKIVSGSWVAWKQLGDNAAAGGPLFVKDAFYNFMCPQRPKTV
jgi:hypothetical protein